MEKDTRSDYAARRRFVSGERGERIATLTVLDTHLGLQLSRWHDNDLKALRRIRGSWEQDTQPWTYKFEATDRVQMEILLGNRGYRIVYR